MQPLIGPRGCGKTTVGMALADSLNRRFVDT
ncbi:shikimate kinase, partial [Shigella sonnei]